MKKSELKDWMIVETGYDNEKMIIFKNTIVDDEINGYTFDDFDDDLINVNFKPNSISRVYEPVQLSCPFELDIEKIFEEHNPKLLWERERVKVSKELLCNMSQEQTMEYINGLVFPIQIIE